MTSKYEPNIVCKILQRAGWILLIALISFQIACAQSPARFQKEIDQFKADTTNYAAIRDLILFTGSSTVRIWTSLDEDFQGRKVLNRGFGGSIMSELLYYADTLILPYKPSIIFIYEGDNDLGMGEEPDSILVSARKLVNRIREKLPHSVICFFSAKPSIARWNLKARFLDFNLKLKTLASGMQDVYYLDMWNPMLEADGTPKKDIFQEDGLHMNRKGYDLWRDAVTGFLHDLHR